MSNILILGAGRVSRPMIRYFLSHTDHRILVASRTLSKAEALVHNHPRAFARKVDVTDPKALEDLIRESDLVVSLVPYAYHVQVARIAIRHAAHVVTTSYISPEMQALDEVARREGVVILNEVGLDPGIDHMSAMQVMDRVRRLGGAVTRFSSCCGGLPAPEANTNPWGYKFSWSPRGVVLAGRNAARYLSNGEEVEVPSHELFSHRWPYEVEDLGRFEIYPNRDSIQYIEKYRLGGVVGMFRGTIRNAGWCETLKALSDLGLLDLEERTWAPGTTYAQFLDAHVDGAEGPLVQRLADRLGVEPDHQIISRFEWMGLLSDRPLPVSTASPLDVVAGRMERTMRYSPGERDLVVLRHEFLAEYPDRPSERIVSTLTAYGEVGGDAAMARTVSEPAAIAARLLVEKHLELPGVQIPVLPDIYTPIMNELVHRGIKFQERRRHVLPGPLDPCPGTETEYGDAE